MRHHGMVNVLFCVVDQKETFVLAMNQNHQNGRENQEKQELEKRRNQAHPLLHFETEATPSPLLILHNGRALTPENPKRVEAKTVVVQASIQVLSSSSCIMIVALEVVPRNQCYYPKTRFTNGL